MTVLATLLVALLGALLPHPAVAQVAVVNGQAVTNQDVDQRIRYERAFSRRNLSRAQAINELIDDRLKLAEGRRQGMRLNEQFLNDVIRRRAEDLRVPVADFEAALNRAGILPATVRDRTEVDAIWSEVLRQRARATGVPNAEINAEIERRRARGQAKVIDYEVRQVIFVVPRGGNPGAREAAARSARSRFQGCDTGIDMLRSLPEVAVRESVMRTSLELPDNLAKLLAATPAGSLTQPFRTPQGIEMLAVCSRTEREDITALRAVVERELSERRGQNLAETLLRELRANATIVRR